MAEMQQLQTPLKPDQIIDIIVRQRWFIIIPLCISLTAGLFLTFTLPRTYSAYTTILVQAQKVPGNYVQSIVSMDLSERISTISQQIMSQTNLEKIIDQFGLYEDKDSQSMYLEDKIKDLRKRIDVKLSRSRNTADAFTISFTGEEPDRVMRIANTLSSFFMDENLKMREAQAVGTSEFLDAELEKTRKRLEDREKALSDYRASYLGGLPDELESNLRTLDRLQQQLTDKQNMLRDARLAVNNLETQMNLTRKMAAQKLEEQSASSSDYRDPAVPETEDEKKLKEAEKILENLQLRYTKSHPDVLKMKAAVKRIKENIASQKLDPTGSSSSVTSAEEQKNVRSSSLNSRGEQEIELAIMQQEMQLSQLQNEIEKIESDIVKINEAMVVYQQRVEDTPKREQELLSLKRDYSNIQEVFSSLLNRKLEAELSVNMEKKQKGEQFRILDHARLPEKPISPDVRKLLIFSLAAGLGCGGGIIFLLELLDGSIRRNDDIEKKIGLPILAAIPPLKRTGDRLKNRIELLLFALFLLYALGLFACFAVVNMKGVIKVIEFLKSFM
ncbi:MAG: protein GumC [Desulfamplus sp.]|nr:protein GumC [Desulfamplus sp.]